MAIAWEEALLIFLTMVELSLSAEPEDVTLMFLTIVELKEAHCKVKVLAPRLKEKNVKKQLSRFVVRLCQVVVHFSLQD
jgi:hypothetical protein